MGDSRRFYEFAQVVSRNFPNRELNIADVAGGKGFLQAALRELGYKRITSWDKRHKTSSNRLGFRWGWFSWDRAPDDYELVVGMHPDEGTDHIIKYAGTYRVPAIVCPCCVKPSAVAFWEQHSEKYWLKYLIQLSESMKLQVTQTRLPMNGRNEVLILKPLRSK